MFKYASTTWIKRAVRDSKSRSDSRRPLRVALVVEAAGGGVAMHIADLIDGLTAHGVEVHLIAPDGDRFDAKILRPEILQRCASVVQVPIDREVSWRDALGFYCVYRELVRIAPDVVHSHSSKAGVLARACLGPWRNVYTPHAFYTLNPYLPRPARLLYGAIERLLGNARTDRLIAVSRDEASHAHDTLGVSLGKIITIYNGVGPFERLPRESARIALALSPDRFIAGFVGRFSFQKGLDRLVAAADVLAMRYGKAIEIVLIGMGNLEEAARRSRGTLPPNIRLMGEIADARRYFGAFDLFVLPSRYEGFPYVYLEAIAAGVPIITTRVAGSEVIEGGQLGLVIENEDDSAPLADAIGTLFEDRSVGADIKARCASAIVRFSAAQMVCDTLKVYKDVTYRELVDTVASPSAG